MLYIFKEAGPKSSVTGGGVKTFPNKKGLVRRMTMIQSALDRYDPGLESILHIHNVTRKFVKNFLGAFEIKNFAKNWENPFFQVQNEASKFLDFATFWRSF